MSNLNDCIKEVELSTSSSKTKRKFKPTYLYVKTHNVTGLKYFGKTICSDPFSYKGSGVVWRRHIKKHGYNVTTEVIGFFENECECKEVATKFSIDNDIVKSKEWANLMDENGIDGGAIIYTDAMKENKRKITIDRIKNGTHPWCGEFQKKRVESGEHHLLGGEVQRKHSRENNLKRVANGTHHFIGSEVNKKMVANGTHPFLGGEIQVENREGIPMFCATDFVMEGVIPSPSVVIRPVLL